MLEEFAGIPCEVEFASEFRYRKLLLDKHTAVIAFLSPVRRLILWRPFVKPSVKVLWSWVL